MGYLGFQEKVKFHKAQGPVTDIEYLEKIDGAFAYKVNFKNGHEFGDGRIDFNAEFEQSGDEPVLVFARSCPCGGRSLDACNSEDIPVKFDQNGGQFSCSTNTRNNMLKCRVNCKDGRKPKPWITSKCYRDERLAKRKGTDLVNGQNQGMDGLLTALVKNSKLYLNLFFT